MKMDSIKASIICVVRNDGYGIHQWERTVIFLKSLNLIPNKNDYELVFVEWNPQVSNESFYQKYNNFFPEDILIKVVTVSNEAHGSIHNPNELPVFEYYGKNVGARHSSSPFLIFTNPDNYFFERTWIDIIENISDSSFLRLCRADVIWNSQGIFLNEYQPELSNLLMRNHFHFYGVPGTDKLTAQDLDNVHESFVAEINHEGASGDFFGISKENFYKFRGYCEYWTYGVYDGIILRDSKRIGLNQLILPKYSIHIDHTRPHLSTKQGTNNGFVNNNPEDWGLINVDGIFIKEYFIKK